MDQIYRCGSVRTLRNRPRRLAVSAPANAETGWNGRGGWLLGEPSASSAHIELSGQAIPQACATAFAAVSRL